MDGRPSARWMSAMILHRPFCCGPEDPNFAVSAILLSTSHAERSPSVRVNSRFASDSADLRVLNAHPARGPTPSLSSSPQPQSPGPRCAFTSIPISLNQVPRPFRFPLACFSAGKLILDCLAHPDLQCSDRWGCSTCSLARSHLEDVRISFRLFLCATCEKVV